MSSRLLALALAALCLIPAFAQPPAWKQLFNGKDLNGWQHAGSGEMTGTDGLIDTHGGMGLLYWTGGKLCEITLDGPRTIVVFFKEVAVQPHVR